MVADHYHMSKIGVSESEHLVDQNVLAYGFAVVDQQGLGIVPDLKPMILPKQLQGGLRVIAELRQCQTYGIVGFDMGGARQKRKGRIGDIDGIANNGFTEVQNNL